MKIAVLKNSVYSKETSVGIFKIILRFSKLFFNSAIFWKIPGGYCKSKDFLASDFNLLVVTCTTIARMQSIPIRHLHFQRQQ